MPRLKCVSFETAIIERYHRRESCVAEALIEMYLAGVSVRRVEDITEAQWDSKVSPATISELNKKSYVHIEDWRNRPCRADGIRMSHRRRQVHGDAGGRGRGVPGRQIPALHGAFLPQYFLCCA